MENVKGWPPYVTATDLFQCCLQPAMLYEVQPVQHLKLFSEEESHDGVLLTKLEVPKEHYPYGHHQLQVVLPNIRQQGRFGALKLHHRVDRIHDELSNLILSF